MGGPVGPVAAEVFARTSFLDRDLSAVSQAGLVNNLNDGMAWGLFPLIFAASGLASRRSGLLAAIYPAVWGVGQLAQAASPTASAASGSSRPACGCRRSGSQVIALSARYRRRSRRGAPCSVSARRWSIPTLLAAIGDVAHPSWRASAVGVYRLWRDLGYAVGALVSGVTADLLGPRSAVGLVALLTLASGVVVAIRLRETRRLEMIPCCG